MVTLCEAGAGAQHRICPDHIPLLVRCAAPKDYYFSQLSCLAQCMTRSIDSRATAARCGPRDAAHSSGRLCDRCLNLILLSLAQGQYLLLAKRKKICRSGHSLAKLHSALADNLT